MIDKYLQRFELVKVIRVVVYFFSTKPDISTQLVAIIKPVLFSYDNWFNRNEGPLKWDGLFGFHISAMYCVNQTILSGYFEKPY